MFRIYALSLALFCLFVKCVAETENKYSENFISSEGFWRDDDSLEDRMDMETPLYLPIQRNHIVEKDQTSRLDVGGLIGTIGLKKGASILGLIVFPLLLPFFILFGFILFFLFLFISIGGASGTAVTTGRRMTNIVEEDEDANNIYQNILDSDECMERISCEIMKRFKTNKSKELLLGILERLTKNGEFTKRISLAAYRNDDCTIYTCDWKNIAAKVFKVANFIE